MLFAGYIGFKIDEDIARNFLIFLIVSASDFYLIGFKKFGAFYFVLFKLSVVYYDNISFLIIFGFFLKFYSLNLSFNVVFSFSGVLGI